MNKKKIFTKLNQLCFNLNCEYNINCGGCCYVAACIAEQLERFSIPFNVIHYDLHHCHFAIKVSDRYINRDGYTKKEITDILCWDSKKLFQHYYDNDWNDYYHTKYNNIIRNKIKELFDENSRI